jgi:isopentenyl diphosphate isomerase/L-lactate dehydrogenase-like FMN-dependent dehydrogenase
VSNHGGRESGSVPAALDVLREVRARIGDRAEVLVDGGVRTGEDVVKALALGARATMIGRPFWWGLAVAGEDGVADVLGILREELVECLAQLGCPDARELGVDFVHHDPPRTGTR